MKHTVLGILAHVDAGKTTLSEQMLYLSGSIRSLGRVDHQSTYLDYDTQERDRGITIYAKQAQLSWKELTISFVDTPGHVDFSSEMERTLQVLDYAILLISASDGVQAHTETIWRLLKAYHIPTFLFINKMDIAHQTKQQMVKELQETLDKGCVDVTQQQAQWMEEVAMCDEELLEFYLKHGAVSQDAISHAIAKRQVFPCFFGSALKGQGVLELLDGFAQWITEKAYPTAFGARVYKISHDEQGNRLTHVKVTGGKLMAKMILRKKEKVDQIRSYSGSKITLVSEVEAGELCVLKGLHTIQAGDGVGFEETLPSMQVAPSMNYRLHLKDGQDLFQTMRILQPLMEEDPSLDLQVHPQKQEIRLQVMGEVQMEILRQTMLERFGLSVTFDEGMVNYRETIADCVEGIGHYEPLRHYAEVHLLLEPLPHGSGLKVGSMVPSDTLDGHWQRLILSHIMEIQHPGVLGGFPITDMSITLVAGKAHQKHTEGGDFRQATYRALRQGLMKAQSVLLEPYVHFQLEIKAEHLSKALYDLEAMSATFTIVSQEGDDCVVKGEAPTSSMRQYPLVLRSYTKGSGRLQFYQSSFQPCLQQEAVVNEINYHPDHDVEHPSSSIFCMQGKGCLISWDQVEQYMHLPLYQKTSITTSGVHHTTTVDDEELKRVYERIYGKPKEKTPKQPIIKDERRTTHNAFSPLPECLLVDGYNMIYDWEELKELAKDNMDAARNRLIDMLSSYQGYRGCELIVVFDAYQRAYTTVQTQHNGAIHIVYTKHSQTADSYIESATHHMAKDYRITVASSDALEQLIVIGQGALRISARAFRNQVLKQHTETFNDYTTQQPVFRHQALSALREGKNKGKDNH